jgi:hypothetical protein
MKKIVLTLGFVIALALVCLFEAPASQSQAGAAPTIPPYCHPCLWYGGDFDPSNPSSNGLTNEDTVSYQGTVYVAFYVPQGQVWTVTGMFANVLSNEQYIIPSKQINWSISRGVHNGSSGVVVASGTVGVRWSATGRTWGGFKEYTALGRLTAQTAVTLTTGVYWMTAVPVCTEIGNCDFATYLLSDVEDVPAPNRRGFQPNDDAFYNSPPGGFFFVPAWGSGGACNAGCDRFSAGLLGHAAAQ